MIKKMISLALIMGMYSGICTMQPLTPSTQHIIQARKYLDDAKKKNYDGQTIDLALAYLDEANQLVTGNNRIRLDAHFGEAYFLKAHIPHINSYDKHYYINEALYYLMYTAHQGIFPQLQVKAQYQISKLCMMKKDIPNAQLFLQFVAQQDIDLELQAKACSRLSQIALEEERLRQIEASEELSVHQRKELASWSQNQELRERQLEQLVALHRMEELLCGIS